MSIPSASSKPDAHSDLFAYKTFQDINRLEEKYRKTIHGISMDSANIIRLKDGLESTFSKLINYIQTLQLHSRPQDTQSTYPRHLLKTYLQEVKTIHAHNISWIILYCDLKWPADDQGSNKTKRKMLVLRSQIHTQAENIWKQLKDKRSNSPREREIVNIKDDLGLLSINSSQWRVIFHKLALKVYDIMFAVLIESKHTIKNRFKIVVSSESAGPDKSIGRKISDWISGYTFFCGKEEYKALCAASRTLAAQFKRCEINRMKKQIFKGSVVLLGLACIGSALYMSDLDDRIYRTAVLKIKRLLKFDHASLALKKKNEFFEAQVLNINNNYSPDEIRQHINFFLAAKLYQRDTGYMYFAENILKGFFLLLSEWGLDNELKIEVLRSAAFLDTGVANNLEQIVKLYDRHIIREKQLREQLLAMRRVFVEHGTFPFMFIALQNDIPYLFIFPERIFTRFILSDRAMKKIGMDSRYYKKIGSIPAVAYMVEGDKYPFKDRAGYFEGEFAVAFSSFAPHPEWTVFHEIGHVIDLLRFQHESALIPENVELNAMLAPLIWAKNDRKEYITERLVKEALKGDIDDYYSQAAKGILNGLLIYLSENDASIKKELITNRFEQEKIKKIQKHLRSIDTLELKKMGYALYHNTQKYLSTAEPGQYVSITTNVEEIIYGIPHKTTQRGFILGGTSIGGPRNGPRFIREGLEDGDMPFSFGGFLSNVIRIIFTANKGLAQATEAEAVAAAIIAFITFNGITLLLHILGTPMRNRMFHGRSTQDIVEHIYNSNEWSKGLSFGVELKERKLLKRALNSNGMINGNLRDEITAFKATANDKERVLFDMCLFLAPFNPAKSAVINKFHDLLFFLPFIGPYLGRAAWIWPVQKAFHQREMYNSQIEKLADSITEHSVPEAILNDFKKIITEFKDSSLSSGSQVDKYLDNFSKIEKLVFTFMGAESNKHHLVVKFISDRSSQYNEESQEFDRLDKYYPGDDIRRIDWKATARSARSEPVIRKYSGPYKVKVGFWLDMRFLNEDEDRKEWARDFVRSVGMIGEDHVLERIIFIMPNGVIHEYVLNLTTNMDNYLTAQKILAKAKEKYLEITSGQISVSINGLKFYSDEENEKFRCLTGLTNFGEGVQQIQWQRLMAKKLNIFIIGDKMNDAKEIGAIIGEDNRTFCW